MKDRITISDISKGSAPCHYPHDLDAPVCLLASNINPTTIGKGYKPLNTDTVLRQFHLTNATPTYITSASLQNDVVTLFTRDGHVGTINLDTGNIREFVHPSIDYTTRILPTINSVRLYGSTHEPLYFQSNEVLPANLKRPMFDPAIEKPVVYVINNVTYVLGHRRETNRLRKIKVLTDGGWEVVQSREFGGFVAAVARYDDTYILVLEKLVNNYRLHKIEVNSLSSVREHVIDFSDIKPGRYITDMVYDNFGRVYFSAYLPPRSRESIPVDYNQMDDPLLFRIDEYDSFEGGAVPEFMPRLRRSNTPQHGEFVTVQFYVAYVEGTLHRDFEFVPETLSNRPVIKHVPYTPFVLLKHDVYGNPYYGWVVEFIPERVNELTTESNSGYANSYEEWRRIGPVYRTDYSAGAGNYARFLKYLEDDFDFSYIPVGVVAFDLNSYSEHDQPAKIFVLSEHWYTGFTYDSGQNTRYIRGSAAVLHHGEPIRSYSNVRNFLASFGGFELAYYSSDTSPGYRFLGTMWGSLLRSDLHNTIFYQGRATPAILRPTMINFTHNDEIVRMPKLSKPVLYGDYVYISVISGTQFIYRCTVNNFRTASPIPFESACFNGSTVKLVITDVPAGEEVFTEPVKYAISYMYDNNQESPLSDTFLANQSLIAKNVKIQIQTIDINSRVTDVLLYRSEGTKLYTLVQKIPINDPAWFIDGEYKTFVVYDRNNPGPTYEARTGLSQVLLINSLDYELAQYIHGHNYVTRVEKTDFTNAYNTIFKSKPNRPDMFDWLNEYITMPETINALAYHSNRLLAFSENNLYIIDPAQMTIEETLKGFGVKSQEHVFYTEGFVVFYSKRYGIYMLTDSGLTNIGEPLYGKALLPAFNNFVNPIVASITYSSQYESLVFLCDGLFLLLFHLPTKSWWYVTTDYTDGGLLWTDKEHRVYALMADETRDIVRLFSGNTPRTASIWLKPIVGPKLFERFKVYKIVLDANNVTVSGSSTGLSFGNINPLLRVPLNKLYLKLDFQYLNSYFNSVGCVIRLLNTGDINYG